VEKQVGFPPESFKIRGKGVFHKVFPGFSTWKSGKVASGDAMMFTYGE